ncbi:hypothetical protein [Marinomonas fungiae]|uniref:hypothetical protein n=1 Tax=Marinomonas fungiae TaxID=1137284 RepID=UPI003A95D461
MMCLYIIALFVDTRRRFLIEGQKVRFTVTEGKKANKQKTFQLLKAKFSAVNASLMKDIMATVTLQGNPLETIGELPAVGSAPSFELVKTLSATSLSVSQARNLYLIFSICRYGVCATSVRKFNEALSSLENTVVLCVSADLPFLYCVFVVQGLR